MSDATTERSSFIEFMRVARRRKWLIVACVLIAPSVAYYHAHKQHPVYSTTSQVLLTPQNPALSYAGITGSSNSNASVDPVRYASTQIFLARSPAIAAQVAKKFKLPWLDANGILDRTSVSAPADTNLLAFNATGGDPVFIQRIANLYAQAYTNYRRTLDTQGIEAAIAQLEASLAQTSKSDAALRTQLLDQIQTLETTEALQRQGTFVARSAPASHQIAPHPTRDAILGLGLGLVLGLGLAFLREASDTRIRTSDDAAARLGMPLLGHLPVLDRRARAERRLVMIDEPYSASAEMFRMLRTSIDLANLDRNARTIMVTSATEGEGKTTTAANLAIAFAGSGRRVILLDLDLRRPTVHSFLGLSSRPGITDVAVGQATLDEALVKVSLEDDHSGGSLYVLPSGPMPPNPGEFTATAAVHDALAELRERADLLIVDTPPVLQVAEALTLSSQLDSMLVIVNMTNSRRGQLNELRRQLDRSPIKKLGFIAIGSAAGRPTQYEHYAPFAYPADDFVKQMDDLVS